MDNIFKEFNITSEVIDLSYEAEKELSNKFKEVDDIALYNQGKILKAFKNNNVSSMHMLTTTGYGYDDAGRDVIEKVYSEIFKAEDSLVRINFVNGTHAISTALTANLKSGDELLYITGMPYDTLGETIGITENPLSLKNNGVKFNYIDLLLNGDFDEDSIISYIKQNNVKMIGIQRSKGYAYRKSITISMMERICAKIKEVNKDIIIFVDNCYGEMVETREPIEVGADLCAGSLIKNLGGGICETGAYIVGRKDLINLCSQRLTCPGIGKECGATLNQNRLILEGLFISPNVVKSSIKAMIFASYMLEKLGFEVMPNYLETRTDIVEAIKFNDEEKLIKFIQGIQSASPVDNHVTPYPWEMPGYEDKVIMAAGTFIQGASIELSADSPIRAPYVAYMQGGITYESAKIAIMIAISNMLKG